MKEEIVEQRRKVRDHRDLTARPSRIQAGVLRTEEKTARTGSREWEPEFFRSTRQFFSSPTSH